jgi:hypothetical protein
MRPGACRAYTLLRLLSSMKHEATRSITSPVPSVTTARRSPCARWITSRSIRRSTCASMWRVLSPRLPSQPRTSRAMNAGPLPGRICSGCHAKSSARQIYADGGAIALYCASCRLRPARSRVFAYYFVDASRHDRLAQGSAGRLGRESVSPGLLKTSRTASGLRER